MSSLQRPVEINRHHHYEFNADKSIDYNRISEDQYSDNYYLKFYDQQDLFFDPGSFMTNSLSVGSRNKSTNYFLSLNNTRQTGVVAIKDGYNRQSARVNVDHKIWESLELSMSNFYSQSYHDEPAFQVGGSVFQKLLRMPTSIDLTEVNEEDGSPYNWDLPLQANSRVQNPLNDLHNWDKDVRNERFSNSLKLDFSPVSFLNLEGSYTIDRRTTEIESFIDKGFLPFQPFNDGRYERSSGKRTYSTASGKPTFQKSHKKVNISSQAAVIFEEDQSRFFDVTALDFRFQDIRSLSNSGSSQGSNPSDPSINRTERTSNDFEVKTLN